METSTADFIRTGDLITFIFYLLCTLGLGLWAGIRTKTTEGYFLGGRKMPGWAVGLSLLGTAISSMTFLAYPGSAYAGNFSRIVGNLAYPVGAILAIFIFIRFYREAGYISAYAYYEQRFGLWARTYVCILYGIAQIWRMGLILYLLSMAVTSMHTELNLNAVIFVIGVFVTVYTVLGGIEAVIWTDVFQTVMLIIGGVVVILVVFANVDGGASTVFSMGAANGKFSLIGHEAKSAFDFSFARDTLLMLWIGGILVSAQEFATDQIKIQRYCAASTARGAKIAALTGAVGCIPLWFLFMFVGASLWVFYQVHPGRLPMDSLADEVFPYFILHELPNGLGGLVIAGVMAAAMSSIDSSMSGMTSTTTEDIYKRILVPGRSDSHYLKVAKLIATASGIGMLFIAWGLTLLRQEAILEILFTVGGFLFAGVAGLFFLGFFTTRANTFGAVIGIILSACATIGLVQIESRALAWDSRESWFINNAIESGMVDIETIRNEILAEAQAKGIEAKTEYIKTTENEILRQRLAEQIREEIGEPAPHLGQAIGIHPFAIGIITNAIAFLAGYLFSFLRRPRALEQIGGLTWWTRHLKRPEI